MKFRFCRRILDISGQELLRIGMGGLRSIEMDAIFLDRREFINVAAL